MSLCRNTLAVVLAGLATACSVSEPLSLQSTGDGPVRGGVALTISDDDAGTDRGRFADALRQAFAAESLPLDANGSLVADYSFTRASATDGLAEDPGPTPAADSEPDWLAQPRASGRFDKCDAQRMRGTLALFDRNTGAMVYRGNASRIECDFSDADVAELAQALVNDAITSGR